MYRIIEVTGQDRGGNWVKPVFNWTSLKNNGFNGMYILAHKPVLDGGEWRTDDNKWLGDIRNEAKSFGFRVGLWINPDGKNLSYAKTFMDLAGKVGVQDDKHLPSDATDTLLPCVMVSAWPAGYSAHQAEGDFFAYFNSILLAKFANVVLALNKTTADFLVNSGSKTILDTLALPSVRIWYLRYGLSAKDMDAEFKATPAKKSVWIAGVAVGESQADWSTVVDPGPVTPPVIPPVDPGTQTKWQKIASLLRQIADEVEK